MEATGLIHFEHRKPKFYFSEARILTRGQTVPRDDRFVQLQSKENDHGDTLSYGQGHSEETVCPEFSVP